jgi:hypothetical protein
MKKWIYVLGILGLGFVIFNNVLQTFDSLRENSNLMIGLIFSLIASLFYGIMNIK